MVNLVNGTIFEKEGKIFTFVEIGDKYISAIRRENFLKEKDVQTRALIEKRFLEEGKITTYWLQVGDKLEVIVGGKEVIVEIKAVAHNMQHNGQAEAKVKLVSIGGKPSGKIDWVIAESLKVGTFV